MASGMSGFSYADSYAGRVSRRTAAWIVPGLLALAMLLLPGAQASALEVLGQAGVLGEWELTARLDGNGSATPEDYSGPLIMRHVGICTQDGPEERAGHMRLRVAASGSRLKATLMIEGVECSYDALKSHTYEGTIACPGREPLPMMVWLK